MLKDTIEKFKEKHLGFNFEEFIQSYLEGESRESLCSKYNVSEMPLRGFLARLGLEFPKSRRYSSWEQFKYRLGLESNINEVKLVKELEKDVDRLSSKNRKLYGALTLARDEANSLRRESRKEVRNEDVVEHLLEAFKHKIYTKDFKSSLSSDEEYRNAIAAYFNLINFDDDIKEIIGKDLKVVGNANHSFTKRNMPYTLKGESSLRKSWSDNELINGLTNIS